MHHRANFFWRVQKNDTRFVASPGPWPFSQRITRSLFAITENKERPELVGTMAVVLKARTQKAGMNRRVNACMEFPENYFPQERSTIFFQGSNTTPNGDIL